MNRPAKAFDAPGSNVRANRPAFFEQRCGQMSLASPCIGICRIDDDRGVCLGCARTLEEIAAWGQASATRRLEILSKASGRRLDAIGATIARNLADASIAWILGSFGAIAEFMWSPGETLHQPDILARVTGRGAIRIALPADVQWVPYKTPSRDPARRRSATALCLPHEACAMTGRTVVTELGPDEDALRDEDRRAILFDVGLAQHQVDAMVRTADPGCLAALRAVVGRPLFEASALLRDLPRLSPHRVFTTRCGRIEVYGPIPPPNGLSPDGPHTHVLPNLLRHGRTHAADLPIPDGLVPCLTMHPTRPDPRHALATAEDTSPDGNEETKP